MPLPDLLADGLKLVVLSSSGHDYSARGDRLWSTLHQIRLTPRELEPQEMPLLLEYGIGLTELADRDSRGEDTGVRFEGGKELRRKIRQFNPGVLVFNGKRAAKDYLQMATATYGLQPHTIGSTRLFVCPTTKAGAGSGWDPRWWDVMSRLL
jgi:TDG/mug DNA glycosylase family protein